MTDDLTNTARHEKRDSEATAKVLEDVSKERARQRGDGFYGNEHDDHHTATDWVAIIAHELGEASDYALNTGFSEQFCEALRKTAAVAVAAIEAARRHKD